MNGSTEVGSIHYDLGLSIKAFDDAAKSVSSKVNSLGVKLKGLDPISNAIGKGLKAIGTAAKAGAIAAVGAFAAVTKSGITISGQLETARQGFVALLGSAEKADKVMSRIKKEAAATPFEMTGLVEGAQALTAVTKDGDKAINVLLDVGKAIATSGKGQEELNRVVMNLQQISSTGKVTAMDIKQFQGAIPMFNDILKYSGLTTEKLMSSSNAAELLFNAFEKAGAEGGITAAGFTAQAGTFEQVISNMQDTWDIFTSDFVNKTGIFDIVKKAIAKVTDTLSANSENIINFVNKWSSALTQLVKGIIGFAQDGDWANDNLWNFSQTIGMSRDQFIKFGLALDRVREIAIKVYEFLKNNWEVVLITIATIITASLIPSIITLIGTISTFLSAFIPVLLIGVAIGVLYKLISSNFDKIKAVFMKFISAPAIQLFIRILKDSFTAIVNNLRMAFESLKPSLETLVEKFKMFWERIQPLVRFLGILIGLLIAGLIIAIVKLAQIISAILGPVLNFLIQVFGWVLDAIGLFVQYVANVAIPAVVEAFKWFVGVIQWVWNFISPVMNLIGALFKLVFAIIAAVMVSIVNNMKNSWNLVKKYMIDPIKNAWDWISNKNAENKQKIQNTFNAIINWIKGVASKLRDAITKPFNDAKKIIEDVAAAIKKAAEKISPFHKSSPSLVEKVQKGIGMISDEYEKLANVQLAPINAAFDVSAIEDLFGGTKVVKQDINVNIENMNDKQDLDALGREIGFKANLSIR